MSSIFFFVFKVLVKSKTKISEERRIRRSEIDFFNPWKKANKPFDTKSFLLFLAEFWIIILLLFVFLCYQVIIQKKIDYLGSSGTYCTPCTAQLRESTNQKTEAFCLCPKQPITVQSSQGHVTSNCRAKFDEKCFEKSLDGAFIQKVVLKWPFVVIQRHLFFIECRYLVYSVTRFDYFLIQKWHFLTVNCTFPTADWDIYQQQ